MPSKNLTAEEVAAQNQKVEFKTNKGRAMPSDNLTVEEVAAQNHKAEFKKNKQALYDVCVKSQSEGVMLSELVLRLNAEGKRSGAGRLWTYNTLYNFIREFQPNVIHAVEVEQTKKKKKKKGLNKNNDKNLTWVKEKYPEFEEWRQIGSTWLHSLEKGLGSAISGVNHFISYLATIGAPTSPMEIMLYKTPLPDFYENRWGSNRTKGHVQVNNQTHFFLEWVLMQPEFCEEDDNGSLVTVPTFSNPVKQLSTSGIPVADESVRPCLPYAYIEEMRKMIAEGKNFSDWKWAQGAIGNRLKPGQAHQSDEPDEPLGSNTGPLAKIWFEVEPDMIDKSDPDCVWRTRVRQVPFKKGRYGYNRKSETIYEMWSPVRWVALLIKLQLPLRTFQVRMLDSGEGDTYKYENHAWVKNDCELALGTTKRPYSNGVFLRPNKIIDGNTEVLLHINTNKSDDSGNSAKGYNVAWVIDGPIHQDPFYWMQKLRRWQSKYNPLEKLTKWTELDGRHVSTAKSKIQLDQYPDTAFLFRTPETQPVIEDDGSVNDDRPYHPVTQSIMDRTWFRCLENLEKRLAHRKETMNGGQPIKLIPPKQLRRETSASTLFSLHSLRVSLITALAIDGKVPLVILQKIAGHSRLLMTLYYCKPGAQHSIEAIQAGVQVLNATADESLIKWLASTEYNQLVKEAIANCPTSLRAAVAENIALRSPAGWMSLVDGACLVSGNNTEHDAPGCHNGGENIGSATSPRYAPVVGGARNCPMCRWFVTRPYFLPQLAARWNNVSYHSFDAREQLILAEERFRELDDRRAAALAEDHPFTEQKKYLEAQRVLENAVQKFEELVHTLAAITRLIERCRIALAVGDGTSLMAVGGLAEFEYSIDEVESELLQVSGVCEGTTIYPDLNPGKAVLRQGQLLDAALMRNNVSPVFLTLSEQDQQLVGNAFVRHLGTQINPQNPHKGRFQVISLIDAKKSFSEQVGLDIAQALQSAVSVAAPKRVIAIAPTRNLAIA